MVGQMNVRYFRALVTVITVIVTVEMSGGATSSSPSPSDCRKERTVAIMACKPVVYGMPPSPYCCHRVRVTHVDCVCPEITPKLAALIDVERSVQLIEGCGRRVPHNYKCGSIITP
ncbi:uncharacterized protein LOC124944127 [Impatiens glandulifera]|uniref:uncharacterized protein LOC124944127 n=1 Tax=Impatiens glandulifera TaxID=253017 RepID=UPI001FB0B74B|nr:uncharacterized protein LOC124944127 [Impatiens glandulifera]